MKIRTLLSSATFAMLLVSTVYATPLELTRLCGSHDHSAYAECSKHLATAVPEQLPAKGSQRKGLKQRVGAVVVCRCLRAISGRFSPTDLFCYNVETASFMLQVAKKKGEGLTGAKVSQPGCATAFRAVCCP